MFLLSAGLLLGPITGILNPDALLGDLLFPIVSVAVSIILFEGSLTLRRSELAATGAVLWRLLSIGVCVTWGATATAAHFLVGLSWPMAILLGAILVVTGPTVIGPMLRSVRPSSQVAQLLRWEGIVIDPLGAVLAIVVFDLVFVGHSDRPVLETLQSLGLIAVSGGLGGALAGYLWGLVLRNDQLPDYLRNPATLLVVVAVFALCESLAHESGLLAVTVMGVWLANMREVWIEEVLDFKEALTVLLVSGLFILLAARLDLSALLSVGMPALALLIAVQFLSRPLQILSATWPAELSWGERGVLAWIAPRGIVAAAIASLFSLRLEELGVPQAELLVPLTFAIIIGTVLWQGFTAPAVARLLGVQQPEPRGILFVGSNRAVQAIAGKLKDLDFEVTVADSVWDNIRAARMAGLRTYYGNPLSRHAEHHLDLSGLGHLFAMSRRYDTNTLACVRYGGEFGRANVYSLPTHLAMGDSDKHAAAEHLRGQWLFSEQMSVAKLNSLLSQGQVLSVTRLSETFEFDDFKAQNPDAHALLAWSDARRLRINVARRAFEPQPGEQLLYLGPSRSESHGDSEDDAAPA